jgi:hypothetical protein
MDLQVCQDVANDTFAAITPFSSHSSELSLIHNLHGQDRCNRDNPLSNAWPFWPPRPGSTCRSDVDALYGRRYQKRGRIPPVRAMYSRYSSPNSSSIISSSTRARYRYIGTIHTNMLKPAIQF